MSNERNISTKLSIVDSGSVEIHCDASKNAIGACLYSDKKLFQCYRRLLPTSAYQWKTKSENFMQFLVSSIDLTTFYC